MTKEELHEAMKAADKELAGMPPEEREAITDEGICAGPNEEQ